MLLLTRSAHKDETIIIQTSDGEVIISIQDVQGAQVRVGVDAPKTIKVFRNEVLERMEAAEIRSHVKPGFKNPSYLKA